MADIYTPFKKKERFTFTNPSKLQQLDRTVHTTSSGMEIIRTFYVEPFDSHPFIQDALQGNVNQDDAGVWTRRAPARDTYIDNCYCNEATVDFADPRVLTSSDTIAIIDKKGWRDEIQGLKEGDFDGPKKRETPDGRVAGAIIKAHFRPLVTAWESANPDDPDDRQWDYLDVKVVPAIQEIPWPAGLFLKAKTLGGPPLTRAVSDEATPPLGMAVQDVAIRRILVGEVPYAGIDQCANAVNQLTWPDRAELKKGMPQWRPRTLKFLKADVQNMMDSEGHRWFEVTYHFQAITHPTELLMVDGVAQPGWVTWNHHFRRPTAAPVGWYEIFRNKDLTPFDIMVPGRIPLFNLSGGRLHNAVDFDPLFELTPPKPDDVEPE